MRLVCPNCGAQYEIDAALVPEGGRDVQCSACGNTWFQNREPSHDPLVDDLEEQAPEPTAAVPEPEPEPDEDEPFSDNTLDADQELDAPQGRRPDEAALAILREEAEREAEARRREAATLESQPELNLPERPSTRPERAVAAAAAATAANRELSRQEAGRHTPQPERTSSDVFPDIDEIKSSLSEAESAAAAKLDAEKAEAEEISGRRGFRIGFLVVVIFVTILIVLYAFAPRLADQFPQARPYLADYVDWANARRDQIDVWMQKAIDLVMSE